MDMFHLHGRQHHIHQHPILPRAEETLHLWVFQWVDGLGKAGNCIWWPLMQGAEKQKGEEWREHQCQRRAYSVQRKVQVLIRHKEGGNHHSNVIGIPTVRVDHEAGRHQSVCPESHQLANTCRWSVTSWSVTSTWYETWYSIQAVCGKHHQIFSSVLEGPLQPLSYIITCLEVCRNPGYMGIFSRLPAKGSE